jgi:long-chain acyl-CoA synthetase
MVAGKQVLTTYRDASVLVARNVQTLQRLGFRSGDRLVCYLDEESVPLLYLIIACVYAGVQFVPLSPVFSPKLVALVAERMNAKGVFTTPARTASIAEKPTRISYESAPDLAPGSVVLGAEPDGVRSPDEAIELLGRLCQGHGPNDVYYIQPTSGTTGTPRFAKKFHRNYLRIAARFAGDWGATFERQPPERCLVVSTLAHGSGQSFLWTPIAIGAELCLPEKNSSACSLDDVRALDPIRFRMHPRVLRSLYRQHSERNELDKPLLGPSAQSLLVGGAPADADLLRYLTKQGIKAGEVYGSTESSEIVLTPIGNWREGYVGKALADVELKLADDGELLAKSPVVFDEYLDEPEATAEAFTEDGFYRTGDFAEITSDGWVRVLGRKREVLNTMDGSNIYASRIESALERLPWVEQAVVIGDQRPFVVALVVPRKVSKGDPALEQTAKKDIDGVNAGLETVEQVRRFALLGEPMSADLYTTVNNNKVRRNRKGIAARYASEIDALYSK